MRIVPITAIVLTSTLFTASVAGAAGTDWQALPDVAPAPADNPTTVDKVELGKMLYFDPRLSSSGNVSCFTCHNVMEGGDDHRPTSIGVHGHVGGRNAPTVWNAAFLSSQFWDGRAATLEDQAKGPPANSIEMGMPNLDAVISRVRNIPGYKPYFEKAFGAGDVVTMENVAKAIAAYERTLITPNSAYDKYAKGDAKALTAQQVRGLKTFAEHRMHQLPPGPDVQRAAAAGRHGLLHEVPDLPGQPVRREVRFPERHRPRERDQGRRRQERLAGPRPAQPGLHGPVLPQRPGPHDWRGRPHHGEHAVEPVRSPTRRWRTSCRSWKRSPGLSRRSRCRACRRRRAT